MRVFEITFPGDRPRLASRDESSEANWILRAMASQLASAAVSLHLFEQADAAMTAALSSISSDREQMEAQEGAAIDELLAEAESARGIPLSFEERAIASYQLREEGARRARQKRWAAGVPPETYRRQAPFTHAAALVHVLDVFDRLLGHLVENWKGTHPGLEKVKAAFQTAIPDLKDVRHSLAHIDERLRIEATLGKKTYRIVGADREIGNLSLTNYRMLVVDRSKKPNEVDRTVPGRVGSIPIVVDTVEAVRVALQAAIDEFQWDGDRRYEPR